MKYPKSVSSRKKLIFFFVAFDVLLAVLLIAFFLGR